MGREFCRESWGEKVEEFGDGLVVFMKLGFSRKGKLQEKGKTLLSKGGRAFTLYS